MPIYESGTMIAGRYEVVQDPREKPSLAGGMGLVYLCVDHAENGRPVALKTFRPELLPDRAARDRFLREGTTWVELGKHAHIVRCHQVFKADIRPEVFFVLELVAAAEGKRDASLRSWLIPGKPLSVEQALLFALHIARGMKHATTKIPGLVHRDLKPENVLVGRDGIVRVTDFGLASAMHEVGSKLQTARDKENEGRSLGRTQLTRGIVGTPLYMAPEQWVGGELDARADIYAFGCILYEMVTGKFVVFGKNVRELKEAHRTGKIGEMPINLPESMSQLLQRCMATNREERYDNWMKVEVEIDNTYKIIMGKDTPYPIYYSTETRADRVAMGWSYNEMGISYYYIDKFLVARDYFNKVLAIGQQEGELALQGVALGNLGDANRRLGDARGAIRYYEQHLAIARELGDRRGEGAALGNLGIAYRQMGDARGAIEYLEGDLAIARELGDRRGEGTALGNLGTAYFQLGDARGAIGYFEQDLAIAREIDDHYGEGQTLCNLGNAYLQLGNARGAIRYFEQALAIMREIGGRHGEGEALVGLGNAYFQLGDARSAIGYFEQGLVVACEIGDRHGEGQVLGSLGNAYFQLGDARSAIGYFEQALVIMREIGDRHGEGQTLGNQGVAYANLGDARQGIEFLEQAFAIMQELGDVINGAMFSLNLALLLIQLGRLREAEAHAMQAAQIYKQVGHSEYAADAQKLLAQIRLQKG